MGPEKVIVSEDKRGTLVSEVQAPGVLSIWCRAGE